MNLFKSILGSSEKPSAERDLEGLLMRLENNGIEYLLEMMSNHDPYSMHIVKTPGRVYSSDDAISWYAFRQAKKLNLSADISRLFGMLENKTKTNRRSHIYFCLAHLCKNLNDVHLFNELMKYLTIEEDENCKSSILIGLIHFQKNEQCNIDPIKELASNGTDRLMTDACHCLRNAKAAGLEDFLIELFNIANNDLKASICTALETCATENSRIPMEKALKRTRSGFLKMMIERVLIAIK